MKKIVKISLSIILGLIGITTLIAPPAFAANDVCSRKGEVPDAVYEAAGCNKNTNKLPSTIQNILNAIIVISGLVAVVFVIIGGIQYMSSTGDPGKIKKAKDTILYALIGLIICVLSFAIVNWTIDTINNSTKSEEESEETEEEALIVKYKDLAFLEKSL